MTLGVIVVAYRDPTSLTRALESLTSVADVVVANVTADAGVAAAARSAGRTCLALELNIGYAAAVNAAEPLLIPEVTDVLFMNDDVVLLGKPAVLSGGHGVRIPLRRTPGSPDRPDLHALPTPGRFLWHWVLGGPPPRMALTGVVPPGTAGNGAAIVVRRDVLRRHPLPEEYFLYWEETAWFWRLRDARISPIVDVEVVVERPMGAEELPTYKAELIGSNLVRLAQERYGVWGRAAYLLFGLAWIARCSATDVRRRRRREHLRYRTAMLRGLLFGPKWAAAALAGS